MFLCLRDQWRKNQLSPEIYQGDPLGVLWEPSLEVKQFDGDFAEPAKSLLKLTADLVKEWLTVFKPKKLNVPIQ